MSRHMGDYRRMVRTEQDLVYATPTTSLVYYHQHDDLWRSPRGTVLRIQALALVAIALSFFLAVFGSCRRFVITLVILMSLALLQLMQLVRCWTSIWATVAFACEYDKEQGLGKSRWMKLKLFLVSSSRMKYYWFDNKYLWQDKLGQYSAVAAAERRIRKEEGWCDGISIAGNDQLALRCIKQAVEDLSWSTDTKGGAGVCLHDHVKVCIAQCLGYMSTNVGKDVRISLCSRNLKEELLKNLPYSTDVLMKKDHGEAASPAYAFTHRVMVWHIATWYCELAEQTSSGGGGGGGGGGDEDIDKNRRVAMDLSKYCAYLVVSAPELLRAPSTETKHVLSRVEQQTREGVILARDRQQGLAAIVSREPAKNCEQAMKDNDVFWTGVHCGKEIIAGSTWSLSWDVLARLWVRTLLYAAPCGDVEAHLQHLSQGGEFITHLWALLYHIGVVDEWETETETGTSGGDQNQIGKNRRHSSQGQAKAAGDRRTAPGTSNIRGKSWG